MGNYFDFDERAYIRKVVFAFLKNYQNWINKDCELRHYGFNAGFGKQYDSVEFFSSTLSFERYTLIEDNRFCCDVNIFPQIFYDYSDNYMFEYGNSANIIRNCCFSVNEKDIDYKLICKLNNKLISCDDTKPLITVDNNGIVVRQTFDFDWLYKKYPIPESGIKREMESPLSDKDVAAIIRQISDFSLVAKIMDIILEYSNTNRIDEAYDDLREYFF